MEKEIYGKGEPGNQKRSWSYGNLFLYSESPRFQNNRMVVEKGGSLYSLTAFVLKMYVTM